MGTKKTKKTGYFRRYFFYDVNKVLAYPLWFCFFRPKRILINENAKKFIKGGALVCLNHRSAADVTYIQMISPHRHNHIVAGEIAFVNKFVSLVLKGLLAIPIDRNAFSYGQFRDIVSLLKQGKLVNIFCEGHLSENESGIDPVKEGPVLMAYAAKVPIVPVYIRPRKSKLERLRIGYGEPLYLDRLGFTSREELSKVPELIRSKLFELMELVENDYNKHNKKKKEGK